MDVVNQTLEVLGTLGLLCTLLAPFFKEGSVARHYLSIFGADLTKLRGRK